MCLSIHSCTCQLAFPEQSRSPAHGAGFCHSWLGMRRRLAHASSAGPCLIKLRQCNSACAGVCHRFDCLNTVMALSHSRDACLAAGGKFVVLFDSGKQQNELEQLRKEERLVKVPFTCMCTSVQSSLSRATFGQHLYLCYPTSTCFESIVHPSVFIGTHITGSYTRSRHQLL